MNNIQRSLIFFSLSLFILGPIHLINIKLQGSVFDRALYLNGNFKFYTLFILTFLLAIYLLLAINIFDTTHDVRTKLKNLWLVAPLFSEFMGFSYQSFKMNTFDFWSSLIYSYITALAVAWFIFIFFRFIKSWLKNNSDISLQVTLIATIITSIVSIITALLK
ncbi:hypothetical protein A4W75_04450 [Latilactobacillus curvatus]|nr:hypothetical protein A4W75_04450 [Latilactobacillus curvatus]